jgi:hypothetical protein
LSSLRRVRDASRPKPIVRAVAGRRKSMRSVDESEIGSAKVLPPEVPTGTVGGRTFFVVRISPPTGPRGVALLLSRGKTRRSGSSGHGVTTGSPVDWKPTRAAQSASSFLIGRGESTARLEQREETRHLVLLLELDITPVTVRSPGGAAPAGRAAEQTPKNLGYARLAAREAMLDHCLTSPRRWKTRTSAHDNG